MLAALSFVPRFTLESSTALATVRPLPFQGDDAELTRALARQDRRARAALYERYAGYVEQLLVRTLGRDREVADALQTTFEIAFRDAHKIEDPRRLRAWLASTTVFVARGLLRKRKSHWLRFFAPEDVPELAWELDPVAAETARAVLRVLDRMPDEERLALTLRRVEEMDLKEVADALGVSLATVKRRLQSAEARFRMLAASEPALCARVAGEEER